MNQTADVRSLEALQDWHNALATFRTDGLEALAACGLEIRRAYDWLADQLREWKLELRASEEAVFQAKADLSNRKFPGWDGRMPDASDQEKALKKALARRERAQEQLEVCRRWQGRLPKAVEETYDGAARQFANLLESETPRELAKLERRIDALAGYASLAPPPRVEAPAPPSTEGTTP